MHHFLLTCSILALAMGCGDPVQRSALTPAIVRPIRTMPIERSIEIGGSATVSQLQTHETPENGDPGVHQSRVDASLHFRARLGSGPSIGARLHLGFLEGASESYSGVPGPRSPLVFGGGPTLSYAYRFEGSHLGFGAETALAIVGVPWAEYFTPPGGASMYTNSGTDLVPLFDVALAFHGYVTDRVILELGASFQNHVYNVGFSTDVVDANGELNAGALGSVPFVGINYLDESGFYVHAQVLFPVGFEPLDVTPVGGALSLGVQLGDPYEPRAALPPP